jgi:erythromycin 3''-O-methyltransferase
MLSPRYGVRMSGWTRENLRHALSMLRYGRNPAGTVYESIGPDFFLALAPGWLNLGLWEGDGGNPAEAPVAVRRLVERLAGELPSRGAILDVGNGLGEQDPLIAEVTDPARLVAVNITGAQLAAGREALERANALPVNADAVRLPFRPSSFDGVISVEAAFHFASRRRFFDEAFRVLRPGGILSMSDVPIVRWPRGPREVLAGVSQLRVWGLGRHAAQTTEQIASMASAAGFADVTSELVGDRVIGPALRFVRGRLRGRSSRVSGSYEIAARAMVSQVELLWERGVVDYLLLRARKP